LIGALALSSADLIGRIVALPNEIPAGIATAVIGGPYLVFLLIKAAQYADQVVAISEGGIYATGTPAELLTPALIQAVFGVGAVVIPHPVDGTPLCVPLRGADRQTAPHQN
jgi:hypothetical protein